MTTQAIDASVLITEDDQNYARELGEILEEEGCRVRVAHDGSEALRLLENETFDVGLLDLVMPGVDGMVVLKKVADIAPGTPFIMLTGHGSIERAVEAVKLGAYDFIEKPASLDRILLTVRNAVEKSRLARKNQWMSDEIMARYAMIGASPAMQSVYALIERVAAVPITVLITGETGTGKELVAHALHTRSHRSDGPLVKVNCAAIPENLIESELFGHVKGAFTNALQDKPGKFRLAHQGTFFLDEIGDMSLSAQAKILRAIESGEIEAVGAVRTQQVDVRVIAATNRNILKMVGDGTFREDLYYRLKGIEIMLPPLAKRTEDIPDLVRHFLKRVCEDRNILKTIHPDAIRRIQRMEWPGQVRELRAFTEKLVVFSDSSEITDAEVQFLCAPGKPVFECAPGPYKEAMAFYEREMLIQALRAHAGSVKKTAESLEIERTNLYKKMKRLGIRPE